VIYDKVPSGGTSLYALVTSQDFLQTGHVVLFGCSLIHSLIESDSNTWKQDVTDAVIGEIGLVEIGHDSLFFDASSAISHAIRFGIFSMNAIISGCGGSGF